MTLSVTALADASDRARFGGKAANLALAIRAGLPVPGGLALSISEVATILRDDGAALLAAVATQLPGWVAVRSSAVDEDGAVTSFAGQHTTQLGMQGGAAIGAAITRIVESAHSAAAATYRAHSGAPLEPRLGIVVQPMVAADVAGVLFTRHPMTGADQRVIEASYGLGEPVVSGRVDPDRFVLARDGTQLEVHLGDKALAVELTSEGVRELAVSRDRGAQLTLDGTRLAALGVLATACEQHFGENQDLEWAFVGESLYLLQWRPITVRRY